MKMYLIITGPAHHASCVTVWRFDILAFLLLFFDIFVNSMYVFTRQIWLAPFNTSTGGFGNKLYTNHTQGYRRQRFRKLSCVFVCAFIIGIPY